MLNQKVGGLQMMKRILVSLACLVMVLQFSVLPVYAGVSAGNASQVPQLKSEAVVLMDQNTGKVLAEKDSHKRMFPASVTKVLTALLMEENLDLNATYTVGKEINLTELDSSGAGLSNGEKITGHDLVWALMLPSGNDAAYTAAVTIARKLAGDTSMKIPDAVESFSKLMNKRAKELGANESNFVNPDGYPNDNHYSTAYDMALISREAMKNDFLKQVVSAYTYTIKDAASAQTVSKNKKRLTEWINKNQMINKKSKYYYEYATGIKTGHTSSAGYCLAASATKGDMSLISVILKADKEAVRWEESKALFEYGFNNFKYHTLMKKGESASKVKAVRKYLNDEVDLNAIVSQDYTDILSDNDFKNIKTVIEWSPKLIIPADNKNKDIRLAGPIKSGQVIGKISYTLNGKILAESQLTADKDLLKGNLSDTIYLVLDKGFTYKYIIIIVLVVFLAAIIFLIRMRSVRKSQRKL